MGTCTGQRRKSRELSLFTGAAGGVLGSKILGWRTVCYVEWEEYCQQLLQQRIKDGWLDDAPIWDDVQTFDGRPWRGRVDVLTAGFPCQPFSIAGQQRAEGDERDMWPDTFRVIREVRPPIAFLENVPNLARGSHSYYSRVLGDLAECGYGALWDIIPAAAACAPHRRERLWIMVFDEKQRERTKQVISDTDQSGRNGRAGQQRKGGRAEPSDSGPTIPDTHGCGGGEGARIPEERRQDLSDADRQSGGGAKRTEELGVGYDSERTTVEDTGRSGHLGVDRKQRQENSRGEGVSGRTGGKRRGPEWLPEPDVGRVVDGVSDRVDRLKSLGNAQVPQQMALAFTMLGRRLCRILDGE